MLQVALHTPGAALWSLLVVSAVSGWLFEPEPLAVPVPVWVRHAGAFGKLDTVHVHTRSGWQVRHCGHPTANFPYLIVTSDGEQLVNPVNGRGFQRLELAKEFVESTTA